VSLTFDLVTVTDEKKSLSYPKKLSRSLKNDGGPDHASSADITALTLAQIIPDQD
jgi:hypothetical protein